MRGRPVYTKCPAVGCVRYGPDDRCWEHFIQDIRDNPPEFCPDGCERPKTWAPWAICLRHTP